MKEFLIISPCGKDSIFTEWISSESNFDLVLLYYDDDLITFEKFKEITGAGRYAKQLGLSSSNSW